MVPEYMVRLYRTALVQRTLMRSHKITELVNHRGYIIKVKFGGRMETMMSLWCGPEGLQVIDGHGRPLRTGLQGLEEIIPLHPEAWFRR